MPTNRLSSPTFARALICHSMASFWSRNHQPLPNWTLPATLPSFVAGLKQGWAFAWHGLIAAEIVINILGQPSLGILLTNDQDQADMASAISIIIVILIIGVVVDLLFNLVNGRIRRRWGVADNSAS